MTPSPATGTTSGEHRYEEQHLAILRHVALYRLTILQAAARALPALGTAQAAGTALHRLVGDGLLIANAGVEGFTTNDPYFTLSPLGAKKAGVPPKRSSPLGGQAIPTHLATLWFCCMGPLRRYRLEVSDWKPLFPPGTLPETNPPPHCVAEDADGVRRIYRVYAPDADPQNTARKLRKDIGESWSRDGLRDWIDTCEYGFAVLAPTPEACSHLQEVFDAPAGGEPPVSSMGAHVLVEHAPSPKTLRMALKGRGGSS